MRSRSAGCSYCSSIRVPPVKSRPKLRPLTARAPMPTRVSTRVMANARLRIAMKGMVFLITGWPSDPQFLHVATAKDQVDLAAREHDGGEHRRQDAERQRDREALDRPGAEGEQDGADQQGGQVTVDDRRVGAIEALVDGALHRQAVLQFLANPRVDQHVG